jgi:acetolactate synthase-1/3 small subunit
MNHTATELTREFALVRVEATGLEQDQALNVVGKWSARLLELHPDRFTVELAGEPNRLTEFVEAIRPFGEITLTRSGELRLN